MHGCDVSCLNMEDKLKHYDDGGARVTTGHQEWYFHSNTTFLTGALNTGAEAFEDEEDLI